MSTRLFQFQDSKSDKFWQITVDGSNHTVQYGRTGTAGQCQTKEFGSEGEARKSADKLIAEKVKKGYIEQEVTQTPTPSAVATPAASKQSVTSATSPAPRKAQAAKPTAVSNSTDSPVASASDELPPLQIPVVHTDVPRTIDLTPTEWRWASWRPHTNLPRPPAPLFDINAASGRLARVPASGWVWKWERAAISPSLSPEEAEYWIHAMLSASFHTTPKKLADTIKASRITGKMTLEAALNKIEKSTRVLKAEIVLPLANIATPLEIAREVIEREREARRSKKREAWNLPFQTLCEGLREYVFPYLTLEELTEMREYVRREFIPGEWPLSGGYQTFYVQPPPAIMLAAYLGMHELVQQVVEAWPDDAYASGEEWNDFYHKPQHLVLALGSPEAVEHHLRRLKLRLNKPEYVAAWLAHTEYGALDLARESIAAITNKEEAESLMGAFTRVHAPEAAVHMLELMLSSKAPRQARTWLDDHPAQTAAGLLPVAAGRGKLADAAVEYLRAMRRKGGEPFLNAALEQLPPEVAERAREALFASTDEDLPVLEEGQLPTWLTAALLECPNKKVTTNWVSPQDLPSVRLGEGRLSDPIISALFSALAQSKLEVPHPLVSALRTHGDRASLDQFAWRLFERWLAEGAPPKDKWAMWALGLLGSDTSALKLTPMIRQWPGESQHQRAVLGLDCLRAIGSDTALMQINGIAQKVPFKGVKTKAGECMEAIAADRGLSRAQLEDRIVPDCDLDERGSRSFDFGSRQFHFVLGENMKPMVKEPDGKLRPDLPKPSSKDDAVLAAAAVEEWKLLKKTVAQVAKIQAVRLEQAMVTGRRWTKDEFELLLVRHPLMTNLVRLLVWGGYSETGELLGTFRVTEDLTYGSSADEEMTLSGFANVGVVHPLHLAPEERGSWGELFADYELVPPFTQLGRQVHVLEPGEQEQTELKRFSSAKIAPQTLVFTLEKLDWQRGLPEDGGVFYSHSKPFYGANVTAVVQYEGVPVGYMEGWDDQSIERCFFIPGIWKPDWYTSHKNLIQLGEVDPVVISEVLGDLIGIAAKAK